MIDPKPLTLPALGPAGKSPTERTLTYLRGLGYYCGIVERRLQRHISVDLFHIIDIVALTPTGVMGVQSTGSDFANHLTKLTVTQAKWSRRWLETPKTSLMLIGWRRVKQGADGRLIWKERVKMITLDDLQA
jgi:hypothetical protein